MPGKFKGENTKKAAGNAKKAAAAAEKQAAEDVRREKEEAGKWAKGAKDTSKKEVAADKAAEAARKKSEREAQLKAEEDALPSKPKGAGTKTAQKKGVAPTPSRKLDLSQLDDPSATGPSDPNSKAKALNASGIDDAIDALSLANNSGQNDKIDRHPERRFKAAYSAYEERRLEEMKDDKSLRRQQKIEIIRKDFEKSDENPFNQAMVGRFDMTKDEMRDMREKERDATEKRLEGD